jgi:hypothetical protein
MEYEAGLGAKPEKEMRRQGKRRFRMEVAGRIKKKDSKPPTDDEEGVDWE